MDLFFKNQSLSDTWSTSPISGVGNPCRSYRFSIDVMWINEFVALKSLSMQQVDITSDGYLALLFRSLQEIEFNHVEVANIEWVKELAKLKSVNMENMVLSNSNDRIDLSVFKDHENIESFYISTKVPKTLINCPEDAKSKAVREFCVELNK